MDIQANGPTPRQRAEDPNQQIPHSDELLEPEDNKAHDDRSPGIPGSQGLHCHHCCGSNIYITVVEPGSTRLYRCEQCRTGLSFEAATFASGRQIPAVQGSVWWILNEAKLRDAHLVPIVEIMVEGLLRQFDVTSNGQPSVLQQPLEHILDEPEVSQMPDDGALPTETEGQPSQEPVAAGSETTETEKEEATASQAKSSAPIPSGGQSASTAGNPSPGVGAKPQSGKGRQKPGPKNKFDTYWDTDIEPLLEKDPDSKFTADGILNILMDRYPGAINVNRSQNAFKNRQMSCAG